LCKEWISVGEDVHLDSADDAANRVVGRLGVRESPKARNASGGRSNWLAKNERVFFPNDGASSRASRMGSGP